MIGQTQTDRQENGGGYTPFSTLGRRGNRVRDLIGRRGGHRFASPTHPGRGLLVVARERGIGLRLTSPPNVKRIGIFLQVSGGKGL